MVRKKSNRLRVQTRRILGAELLERRLLLTAGPDGTPFLYLQLPYANLNHSADLYLTEGQRDRLNAAQASLGQAVTGPVTTHPDYQGDPDQLSSDLEVVAKVVDQLVSSGGIQPQAGSGQRSEPYSYIGYALISDRGEIEVSGVIPASSDSSMYGQEHLQALGIRDAYVSTGGAQLPAGAGAQFIGWVEWDQLDDLAQSGQVEYLQLPAYPADRAVYVTQEQEASLPFTESAACHASDAQTGTATGTQSDPVDSARPVYGPAPAPAASSTVASLSSPFSGPLPANESPATTPTSHGSDDEYFLPSVSGEGQLATDHAIADLFEPLSNDKFCTAFNS